MIFLQLTFFQSDEKVNLSVTILANEIGTMDTQHETKAFGTIIRRVGGTDWHRVRERPIDIVRMIREGEKHEGSTLIRWDREKQQPVVDE